LKKKYIKLFVYFIIATFLIGCEKDTGLTEATAEIKSDETVQTEDGVQDFIIEQFEGTPVNTYDVIYTLDEIISLTFDRILPKNELIPLLDALDEYKIQATFFGSLEQLVLNPEAVNEILQRGHDIENHALYKMNVKSLTYEDIYRLIKVTNEQIEIMTGNKPKYVQLKVKKSYENVNRVAAQLDMSGVINYSYQLRGLKTDDEKRIKDYMRRAVARGGIISMDPADAHAIPFLIEAVKKVDFDFVSLDDLLARDQKRKTFTEIEDHDAIKKNLDFTNVEPFLHVQEQTDKKEVALTFDDWASEEVVLEVLDILDKYNIQSTFYLKTQIVRENPNLARLLIERGHEVANHSHSHQDSTNLSSEELQEDVYKAHKIITEAIQEQPKLYFRPPFGKIDDKSAQAIAAMGFEALGMYDVSSYDWNADYTEEDVIERVMSRVKPGSVIVMHILNDIHTPNVLPDIIEALLDEGYSFVPTSKWLE